MYPISFDANVLRFSGKPGFLYSGEIPFFRCPKKDWRYRMQLLKDAGANAVSTYIPWVVLEPEEGKFHIDAGDGISDISEYLECAAQVGLAVIARPGPYQYSELLYAGLPEWLCKNYPEILSQDRKGNLMGTASVSYCHPLFLEKVGNYFDRVAPILAKYSAVNGGPIVLIQPDNEVGGVHLWNGDCDFNRETMGFGKEDGRYARFLREKRKTPAAANEAYGTHHATFGEFSPADEPVAGDAKIRWNRDYFDFYCTTIAEYLKTLIDMLEARGVKNNFVHNAPNTASLAMMRETRKILKDKLLIGCDLYYTLDQKWEQNSPTPQYAVLCYLSGELQRALGYAPSVLEFQFGSLSDWPPITGVDVNAALWIQAASGVRGINGYIFTGGRNVPGTCITGEVYDFSAPVGADNSIRDHYYAIQNFGLWRQAHPELNSDRGVYDFRIMMCWRSLRANNRWGIPASKAVWPLDQLWEFLRRGLTTSAFSSALQPQIVDGENAKADWWNDISMPLVVPCDGTMEKEAQERLVAFMERGGRILCLPILPHLDEEYRPCTILADALGGAVCNDISPTNTLLPDIAGIKNVFCNRMGCFAQTLPKDAAIIGADRLSQKTMAWEKQVGGKGGKFIWLGMAWLHAMNDHGAMLTALLESLGMARHIKTGNSWLFSLLRQDEKGWKFYLQNLSTSPQQVDAQWRPDANSPWRSARKGQIEPMETAVVELLK